jgi:hypothetical protein
MNTAVSQQDHSIADSGLDGLSSQHVGLEMAVFEASPTCHSSKHKSLETKATRPLQAKTSQHQNQELPVFHSFSRQITGNNKSHHVSCGIIEVNDGDSIVHRR